MGKQKLFILKDKAENRGSVRDRGFCVWINLIPPDYWTLRVLTDRVGEWP